MSNDIKELYREQMYGYQQGKGMAGRNWETGTDTYTLLILGINQITNENLPDSTGNSTTSFMVT